MTEFQIHTIDTAPDDAQEALEGARQKFGFLPNVLGELASSPPALKAYLGLGELLGETSLTPLEQQIVLISASRSNGCTYCVAAHSAGLKMAGAGPDLIESLRDGRSPSDGKLAALAAFTVAIVERRGEVTDGETKAFLAAGYRLEQILEVLIGVAMKTISNYTNHIARTPLDAGLQPFAWTPK